MDENLENSTPTEKTEAPQYTDIEVKAMEMGWRPKSEFHGDDVDFIDAKEFVNRKPLFDKIEYQSKHLKQLTRSFEALKQHYTKVKETEFNNALAALRQDRRNALQNGDGEAFERADEQIKNVEAQINEVKQTAATPAVTSQEPPQEFVDWVNKNSWYNTSKPMRAFADELGRELAGSMPPSEVLKRVEQSVRTEFAHKFTNPNKASAPEVSGGTAPVNRSSKNDDFVLTDLERKIMNDLIRQDPVLFTKEKYIAELKAVQGRK